MVKFIIKIQSRTQRSFPQRLKYFISISTKHLQNVFLYYLENIEKYFSFYCTFKFKYMIFRKTTTITTPNHILPLQSELFSTTEDVIRGFTEIKGRNNDNNKSFGDPKSREERKKNTFEHNLCISNQPEKIRTWAR